MAKTVSCFTKSATALDVIGVAVEYALNLNKSGTQFQLPANNVVREVWVSKFGATLLTAGRSVAVGFPGTPRILTNNFGALTDDLNLGRTVVCINPAADGATWFLNSTNAARTLLYQGALGGDIISGRVKIVVIYEEVPYKIVSTISY